MSVGSASGAPELSCLLLPSSLLGVRVGASSGDEGEGVSSYVVVHFLHPVPRTHSWASHLRMAALVDAASKPPEGKGCNCNDPSKLHNLLHSLFALY